MQSRIELEKPNPAAYQAMLHRERYVRGSPTRLAPHELKTIAERCDLLVLLTSPDALALGRYPSDG